MKIQKTEYKIHKVKNGIPKNRFSNLVKGVRDRYDIEL